MSKFNNFVVPKKEEDQHTEDNSYSVQNDAGSAKKSSKSRTNSRDVEIEEYLDDEEYYSEEDDDKSKAKTVLKKRKGGVKSKATKIVEHFISTIRHDLSIGKTNEMVCIQIKDSIAKYSVVEKTNFIIALNKINDLTSIDVDATEAIKYITDARGIFYLFIYLFITNHHFVNKLII